jgi:hypothetical protein
MIRKTLVACLLATACVLGAQAADGPQLLGGMADAEVMYGTGPKGSAVGGGAAQSSGGGEERMTSIARPAAVPGRAARLSGGGEDAMVLDAPGPAARPRG